MKGLRRSAWLVAAAAILPLLLFLALQTAFSARDQRRVVEEQALAKSASVSLAADGEVMRIEAGLDAVATARSLRRGDLAEFRSRASELIKLYDGWEGVGLVDLDNGSKLVEVGAPGRQAKFMAPGQPTQRLRLAGFVTGPGCPCLVFDRLAIGPPGKRIAVQILVDTRRFEAMLPPGGRQYEVSAIVGPQGRFVARSLHGEERFGQLGSESLRRAAVSGEPGGIYRGVTLESFQSYTAFTRSPMTGWSTHIALDTGSIDNPGWQYLASFGVAALLALLLATVLIWFALRQVAEGRRIMERVQQSQKLEALGQLTGGLAHDFNNLLTPIVGALDFLVRKPELDARSKRIATGALTSAERAGKLTNHLLAFSRRQKLQVAPIRVATMLEEMEDLFRQSVGDQHRIEIIQKDTSLCAHGDLNQLELAVLNLMLNARDAMPHGGVIRLNVVGEGEEADGTVAIAVQDDGIGMDDQTRLRAVEPFFTTKAQGSGTGLGLAQVFGMATQSGGTVEIDSAPGEGTTVTLRLIRCPAAAAQAEPERSENRSVKGPLRLLVVDDEPEVRATIVRPLEEAGHVVDAVSDGPTALAAIGERSFDLVLVDFAMPGMNGAELIQQARALRNGGRYLMITGYSDSEAVASASPNTPILKKPFDSVSLVDRVHSLVNEAG